MLRPAIGLIQAGGIPDFSDFRSMEPMEPNISPTKILGYDGYVLPQSISMRYRSESLFQVVTLSHMEIHSPVRKILLTHSS